MYIAMDSVFDCAVHVNLDEKVFFCLFLKVLQIEVDLREEDQRLELSGYVLLKWDILRANPQQLFQAFLFSPLFSILESLASSSQLGMWVPCFISSFLKAINWHMGYLQASSRIHLLIAS